MKNEGKSVYFNYPKIDKLSVSDRINYFKDTVLDLLENKKESITKLQKVAMDYEREEKYEAAQGVLLAIEEFNLKSKSNGKKSA